MSDDKITLYKIGLLDIVMTMLTSGFWLIFVIWQNGVEIDAPDEVA